MHQKLKEEIEKNSNGRLRYLDAELYLRNNQRSPDIVARTSQLNFAVGGSSNHLSKQPSNTNLEGLTSESSSSTRRDLGGDRDGLNSVTGKSGAQESKEPSAQDSGRNHNKPHGSNKNCQVCLIKEVRQNLMNINKVVQERNEQLLKLRGRCYRSYFERRKMKE